MATVTADLGSDISCVSDLDPTGYTVSGRRALAEAIARRLTTPRGRLVDDANYGLDLTQLIDSDLAPVDLAKNKAGIEAECLKDERVVAASATLTFLGNVLMITVLVQDSIGPFTLVLAVTSVTVTLLQPST